MVLKDLLIHLKKGNMSSPLYRRQLVTGGVNIGLVSAAGAPQNLLGEAIAGIGSAIGEAIAAGKEKELMEV